MKEAEIQLLRQPFSALMYVGDISGIFQNTTTPTCCVPLSKGEL